MKWPQIENEGWISPKLHRKPTWLAGFLADVLLYWAEQF
jgi:hypothetical protein